MPFELNPCAKCGSYEIKLREAMDTELDVFAYRSGNAAFMYVCECLKCHNKTDPVMFPQNAVEKWNELNT